MDIPILLGLDYLPPYGIDAKVTGLTLSTKDWSALLTHRYVHLYLEICANEFLYSKQEAQDILFSKKEPTRLHKKFGQVNADKLFKLMSKAGETGCSQDLSPEGNRTRVSRLLKICKKACEVPRDRAGRHNFQS